MTRDVWGADSQPCQCQRHEIRQKSWAIFVREGGEGKKRDVSELEYFEVLVLLNDPEYDRQVEVLARFDLQSA